MALDLLSCGFMLTSAPSMHKTETQRTVRPSHSASPRRGHLPVLALQQFLADRMASDQSRLWAAVALEIANRLAHVPDDQVEAEAAVWLERFQP